MGPGRTATIQEFWKTPPQAEAVTMSTRTTPVISKFKLLTEVVTTNMYQFSSLVQSGGTMGLINLTTDVVADVVQPQSDLHLDQSVGPQFEAWLREL